MKRQLSFIKKASTFILVFLMGNMVYSQKLLTYPIADIPENLSKNSNAVVREDITKFEIINSGEGKSYMKYAITIFNKKADDYAEIRVGYDKISKITSLDARSYDKAGRLIKQLKNKDIKDFSSFGGSIYSDNRMKYFDLRYPEYPYTVVYEVEMKEEGLFVIPGWVPFSRSNVASQKSTLEVSAPADYDIRYLELNMEPMAKENIRDGRKVITWEFGSFEPIERETYS